MLAARGIPTTRLAMQTDEMAICGRSQISMKSSTILSRKVPMTMAQNLLFFTNTLIALTPAPGDLPAWCPSSDPATLSRSHSQSSFFDLGYKKLAKVIYHLTCLYYGCVGFGCPHATGALSIFSLFPAFPWRPRRRVSLSL